MSVFRNFRYVMEKKKLTNQNNYNNIIFFNKIIKETIVLSHFYFGSKTKLISLLFKLNNSNTIKRLI